MLKQRVKNLIADLELPITVFCRKVQISQSAYYRWMDGTINFKEETEDRVRAVLDKYGF